MPPPGRPGGREGRPGGFDVPIRHSVNWNITQTYAPPGEPAGRRGIADKAMTSVFISVLQEIVGTLLIFVLFFGIGFILNMLVKTTWLPAVLYVVLVIPLGIWYAWKPDLSPGQNLSAFFLVWFFPLIGGAVGAAGSGWAIRELRRRGYRMF